MSNGPTPTYSSRRSFIKQAALVSMGFVALSRCTTTPKPATVSAYPKLRLDPNEYLDLPAGFKYRIISHMGQRMDDGFYVPGRADGMGTFAMDDGKVLIVRNHENSPDSLLHSPFGRKNKMLDRLQKELLYDYGKAKYPGLGGTTNLVYNEVTGKVEQQFLSLAGTYRNCAGGVTPWGTWLSCEEDITVKGGYAEKDHGFVFEVPASAKIEIAPPKPIEAMGRFNHEAVAVDPTTGIVYQTEDAGDGLLYRYIPNVRQRLHEGGRLQALAIIDQPSLDTRNWGRRRVDVGQSMAVRWIDMEDILDPKGDLRQRGFKQGAARFARGEGIWFGEGELYFACTNGGPNLHGQVFRYRTSPQEGTTSEESQPGILELFAESTNKSVLHMCDNLTIAPWGDLILCEDNGELNHIKGINPKGEVYEFGINRSSSSEFAGVVFSPSGKTMFVNIQESGETLAITGDWSRLAQVSAGVVG
ncbi:MAG: alkaline phosphatase PhoX [Bacteroidota bacterium]